MTDPVADPDRRAWHRAQAVPPAGLQQWLAATFPDATRICSTVPEVTGTITPDQFPDWAAPANLDVSLHAWHDDHRLYRPLAYTCAAVALACLALAATRPAPLLLGLALVVLLSIPWVLAGAHHLTHTADEPTG